MAAIFYMILFITGTYQYFLTGLRYPSKKYSAQAVLISKVQEERIII